MARRDVAEGEPGADTAARARVEPAHDRTGGDACGVEALDDVASIGLQDVVRPFHPQGGVFSWWDYRGRGFERGNGLRIDHVYCTPKLAERAIGAVVDRAERARKSPSDHAPVIVEFA